MITPQLAVQYIQGEPENRHKEIHDFVVSASAKDLLELVCLFDQFPPPVPSREWQIRAGMAIDIRIADEQTKSAEKLEHHTVALVELTKALLGENKFIRRLTVGLFILTAGLLIFTICLVIRH
jgi:hypothetical protein